MWRKARVVVVSCLNSISISPGRHVRRVPYIWIYTIQTASATLWKMYICEDGRSAWKRRSRGGLSAAPLYFIVCRCVMPMSMYTSHLFVVKPFRFIEAIFRRLCVAIWDFRWWFRLLRWDGCFDDGLCCGIFKRITKNKVIFLWAYSRCDGITMTNWFLGVSYGAERVV